MKIIKAVDLLKKAGTSLVEAIYIDPDNDFINETDRLIKDAITILKTARYDRPNNKDCLNCSNSFTMKDDRLICMAKQKAGESIKASIVPEDGYCGEWN